MKGLLLKEFYSLKNNLIFFILYFICMIVGFSSSQNLQIYMGALTFVIMHASTTYDEKSNWDTYSIALPCSRAMIVSSKYLFTLILTVVAIIPGIIINAINNYDPFFVFTSFQALIIPGMGLLFDFYFGATKSYLASFFLALLIILPILLASSIRAVISNNLVVNFIVAGIYIAIYAISWIVAIALYKKRQL